MYSCWMGTISPAPSLSTAGIQRTYPLHRKKKKKGFGRLLQSLGHRRGTHPPDRVPPWVGPPHRGGFAHRGGLPHRGGRGPTLGLHAAQTALPDGPATVGLRTWVPEAVQAGAPRPGQARPPRRSAPARGGGGRRSPAPPARAAPGAAPDARAAGLTVLAPGPRPPGPAPRPLPAAAAPQAASPADSRREPFPDGSRALGRRVWAERRDAAPETLPGLEAVGEGRPPAEPGRRVGCGHRGGAGTGSGGRDSPGASVLARPPARRCPLERRSGLLGTHLLPAHPGSAIR